MTGREKFLGIARGELKGELFLPFNLNYGWFMAETVERWQREGLPEDVDFLEFFGLDRVEFTGGQPYSLIPAFEEELISEDENTKVVRDGQGVTKRIFKHHADSKMPQWIGFPVKTREDFEEIKRRLDPKTPSRTAGWERQVARWKDRDHPLGLASGSFYGHTLQRWVGTENLCMMFYDDPSFVHEMLEYLEYFFLELIQGPLGEIEFDFASYGEDIAYKGRSFISPKLFKEFLQPHYVKSCQLMRENGIELIFVDSDGLIDELIPLWMEVGINGFSPLEVAAGSDAIALKKLYGDDIVMAGNIDKRALMGDKAHIDREVEKVKTLLDMGGFFPAVDHSVPPNVSLENFEYLLQGIR